MNALFDICTALSIGLMLGTVCGGLKAVFLKKHYSPKKIENTRKLLERAAVVLKYVTFVFLGVGFVWCVYFLILGITLPEQSEYANNMSSLIAAVLTVISVLFAFVEFIKKK